MPRLALVDDIELACLLPFKEHPGKQIVLVEPTEPLHFHIAGVSHAMGAWQYGGVTQGSEPMLVLDATYHAGHPEARGTWRKRGGELASDLVDDGDDRGPRTCEVQSGRTRTDCRQRLPLCPVTSPAGQPGRLSAVLELQNFCRPKRREIHQLSRAQHVGVRDERSRPAPPRRVDLGEQKNPNKRCQVTRRAAHTGLVVANLTHQ